MRVGLNALHLVPRETGGGELYVRRLVPALLEAGREVVLYAHPENRFWDGLRDRVRIVAARDESELPDLPPIEEPAGTESEPELAAEPGA